MKLKNKKKETFFEPLSDKVMGTIKGGAIKAYPAQSVNRNSNKK